MPRAISNKFLNDLRSGCLMPITEYVKMDKTLDMELRNNSVIIYYRGSKLAEIFDTCKIVCNPSYWNDIKKKYSSKGFDTCLFEWFEEKPDINLFICKMPYYKRCIDAYMGLTNANEEKEFVQLVTRENNYGTIANATDYYIIDTEYIPDCKTRNYVDEIIDCGSMHDCEARKYWNEANAPRFDLIAVNWESNQTSRKNTKALPITIIEMKYGDGAMTGTSGIISHINDYINFRTHCNFKAFADDMSKVFNQKHELGLFDSAYNGRPLEISLNTNEVEFVFIFSNHDPESCKMKQSLKEAVKFWKGKPEGIYLNEIRIAESSCMGYGLYAYEYDCNTKKRNNRFKTITEFCGME